MKLRITVEGKTYDVDVEPAEPLALESALSRVEGGAIGRVMPKAPSNHQRGPRGAAASTSATPAAPAHSSTSTSSGTTGVVQPAAPAKAPWHGLTTAAPGDCVAPAAAVVERVRVKVGDSVRANDALVDLRLAGMFSMSEHPLVGSVRTLVSGTVSDVGATAGDQVAFGQLLVRVKPTG